MKLRSETIGKLMPALVKAQAAIRNPPLDATNQAFKGFRYATLGAHLEAVRGPLAAQGIILVQAVDEGAPGGVCVLTSLVHESGEWIGSRLEMMPRDQNPQSFGSTLTYARRYAISSLVGIVGEDDDDGNAASGEKAAKPSKPAAKAQTEQRFEQFRVDEVQKKCNSTGKIYWLCTLTDELGGVCEASTFSVSVASALTAQIGTVQHIDLAKHSTETGDFLNIAAVKGVGRA